jgi:hypothetical protein
MSRACLGSWHSCLSHNKMARKLRRRGSLRTGSKVSSQRVLQEERERTGAGHSPAVAQFVAALAAVLLVVAAEASGGEFSGGCSPEERCIQCTGRGGGGAAGPLADSGSGAAAAAVAAAAAAAAAGLRKTHRSDRSSGFQLSSLPASCFHQIKRRVSIIVFLLVLL